MYQHRSRCGAALTLLPYFLCQSDRTITDALDLSSYGHIMAMKNFALKVLFQACLKIVEIQLPERNAKKFMAPLLKPDWQHRGSNMASGIGF